MVLNVGFYFLKYKFNPGVVQPILYIYVIQNVINTFRMPNNHNSPVLRRVIDDIVRYLIPLSVSVVLVLWVVRKVDVHSIIHIIKHGCDYKWVILMMLITTLSHIVRGARWGIQLRAVGVPRMSLNAYSVSIFGAYALNLVVPRLGEVWRCVYVSHKERVPLSTVIGTDLGDRGSDFVVVALLGALALIVAHPQMMSFIDHYSIGRDLYRVFADLWVWVGVAGVVLALWAVFHFMSGNRYVISVRHQFNCIWTGFKVLFSMKGIKPYLWLTLGIWTCYYLETYVCFMAFPFTRELITEPGGCFGLVAGLVVFVFGSYSMAIPSNGGLGPWNIAVMFALSLFGVNDADAAAYSLVVWGMQALMLVLLGVYSGCYIFFTRNR